MEYAKPLIAEIVKLSLAVFTFIFLNQYVFGVVNNILAQLGLSFLSAVILVLVLDVIFGRPVIQAVWSIRYQPVTESWPRIRRSTDSLTVTTPISLQYTLKGSGILQYAVKMMLQRSQVSCELVLEPQDVAQTIIDKGTNNGHNTNHDCERGVLKSHFIGGLGSVGSHTCEFEIVCYEDTDKDEKLGCKLVLHRSRHLWLLRMLVKCDPTIEGFIVGRA